MSRESLLDEAIAKAKESEDWQLVEWLRLARGGESAAKWYTAKFNQLKIENAKFRDALRVLIVGTNAELCAGRDYLNCKECSMHRDRESCAMTDAMGLLGCDAYGEPMES